MMVAGEAHESDSACLPCLAWRVRLVVLCVIPLSWIGLDWIVITFFDCFWHSL